MAYNADGLYPDRAKKIERIHGYNFVCHGYSFEEFPDAFHMHPFTDRANSSGMEITFSLNVKAYK